MGDTRSLDNSSYILCIPVVFFSFFGVSSSELSLRKWVPLLLRSSGEGFRV